MKEIFFWFDSRSVSSVPQPAQRILSEDYAQKIERKIVYYSAEEWIAAPTQIGLREKIKRTSGVSGFIFFTIKQFDYGDQFDFPLIKEMLAKGFELHFAREAFSLFNLHDLKEKLTRLYLYSASNKNTDGLSLVNRHNENAYITASKEIVLDERSKYLRHLVINALEGGKRGHVGSSLSLIEILRVLYDSILKYNAADLKSPDRDRFILSKGHGCLALYAILADKQFFPISQLKTFCHFHSMLGGHPDSKIPGVEISTGSLGHGLSIGVGMAIAAKMQKKDHRVFVVMGDGELNEGSVWEAAMCAAKHNLDNLIAIVDRNHYQSYGASDAVLNLSPLTDKWKSFGFSVMEVNGHDVSAIENKLLNCPFQEKKPSILICHTIKGRGIEMAENTASWHHKASLSELDIKNLYEQLGVE